MENRIYKAEIKPNHSKKALTIWYIIAGLAFLIGTIGMDIFDGKYVSDKTVYISWYLMFCWFLSVKKINGRTIETDFSFDEFILGFLISAAILLPPVLIVAAQNFMAKRCSLELDKDGINGNRKTLFSNKNLNLPMEQIDALMVSEGLLDKFSGGKTIVIRSVSGVIKFPWVQNADEFVSRTLDEIKKFKESVNKHAPAPAPAAPASGSELEQLQKLKDLLDSGVITQEEFEAKKKQLLGL